MKNTFCLPILLITSALAGGSARAADLGLLPAAPSVAEMTRRETSAAAYVASSKESSMYRAWKISLAPMIAGQVMDVASSYGMREMNPMLAGPDGRFGAKGASIKLGVAAAVVGVEYLMVRKHPRSAAVLSKMNWASAVLTGSFAAHNYAIRK